MKSRKGTGPVLLIRALSFSASKFTLELYQKQRGARIAPRASFLFPALCFLLDLSWDRTHPACGFSPKFLGSQASCVRFLNRYSWDRRPLACGFSTGVPGIAGLLRAVSQPVFLGSQASCVRFLNRCSWDRRHLACAVPRPLEIILFLSFCA